MDRRAFLAAATAAAGASGFGMQGAQAQDLELQVAGSPLNLTGYKTVFRDGFTAFNPYHPVTNPTGHWATATNDAFAGSLKDRCPKFAGEHTIFTDATMGEEFNPYSLRGGRLVMEAREIPVHLRARAAGRRFMAPRLQLTQGGTLQTFRYGYFEARVQIEAGNSAHAAFWLNSNYGWTGEVDIMEYLGHWPRRGDMYHTGAHMDWGKYSYGENTPAEINGRMRRFGLLWTPRALDFYLDRRLVRSLPNPGLHMLCYLTINLAVGTRWSLQKHRGGGGMPESTDFPMLMRLDNVVVMQRG